MLELKILPYPLDGFKVTTPNVQSGLIPDTPAGIPQPVSSVHGKIKTLLFVIPDGWIGPLRYNYLNLFYELVKKMDTVETFIIFHYEQEFYEGRDFKAKTIPYSSNRIHSIKINRKELSVWAQDLFYPVHYINESSLEKTICFLTGNRGKSYKTNINTILEKKLLRNKKYAFPFSNVVECKDSNLPFQGGNVLVGDKFILIGKNHEIITNPKNTYEKWFGKDKKIIFISTPQLPKKNNFLTSDGFNNNLPCNSTWKQPLIHIDLYITLAGYNKKGDYTLVIGKPTLAGHFPSSMNIQNKELLNHWLEQMTLAINTSIKQLKEDSPVPLKIVRTPLVLTYIDYVGNNSLKRKWFWTSYNNCLVEVYEDEKNNQLSKKVWLPSYGGSKANYTNYVMPYDSRQLKAELAQVPIQNVKHGNWEDLSRFDKQAKETWKKLGFKVCLLKNNYLPLMADRGSLNCITNCIERL